MNGGPHFFLASLTLGVLDSLAASRPWELRPSLYLQNMARAYFGTPIRGRGPGNHRTVCICGLLPQAWLIDENRNSTKASKRIQWGAGVKA